MPQCPHSLKRRREEEKFPWPSGDILLPDPTMELSDKEQPVYRPIGAPESTTESGTPTSGPEKATEAHLGADSSGRSPDDGSDIASSEPGDPELQSRAHNVIDRVLSRASTHSVHLGPPPNGGFVAWRAGTYPCHEILSSLVRLRRANILPVLCMHLLVMNSW